MSKEKIEQEEKASEVSDQDLENAAGGTPAPSAQGCTIGCPGSGYQTGGKPIIVKGVPTYPVCPPTSAV